MNYTVLQLDELRKAVKLRWLYGTSTPAIPVVSYDVGDKHQAVEEIVRTHMLAGHTAADLYAADAQ